MRRVGITGLVLAAALVLSGFAAGSASAVYRCLAVIIGLYLESNGVGEEECRRNDIFGVYWGYGWSLVQEASAKTLAPGEECAPVEAVEPSLFDGPNCGLTEEHKGEGEYEIAFEEGVAGPRFTPLAGKYPVSITGSSGSVSLETASTKPVDCATSATTGSITGPRTVGSVMITFSGCHSTEGSGCSVKGGGASTGKILTSALDGELGLATQSTLGIALLLLPTSGTEFVKLEGSCLLVSPAAVDGSLGGELTPINRSQSTDKLIVSGSTGKQSITSIKVLSTTVKPSLKAFGLLEASVNASASLAFGEAVRVT
jgi:hypothetical protein